jgi:uncharacterized Zn finger protein (UPF0148 family)
LIIFNKTANKTTMSIENKSSYQYLLELSKVRNKQNSLNNDGNPITNRVIYILNQLNELDVKYKTVIFDSSGVTIDPLNYEEEELETNNDKVENQKHTDDFLSSLDEDFTDEDTSAYCKDCGLDLFEDELLTLEDHTGKYLACPNCESNFKLFINKFENDIKEVEEEQAEERYNLKSYSIDELDEFRKSDKDSDEKPLGYFGVMYKKDTDRLINIIVEFKSTVENSLPGAVFIAHHDINNPHSQNCQDNTASVSNLLELCGRLSKTKNLDRNIYVVFTDREEFGGIGARNLSQMINSGKLGEIGIYINLELTGLGTNIWVEDVSEYRLWRNESGKPTATKTKTQLHIENIIGGENIEYLHCPFNDAVILRSNGIDGVCIGTLPDIEIRGSGYKRTWSLCHSMSDTVEKCDGDDMKVFVDRIYELATK